MNLALQAAFTAAVITALLLASRLLGAYAGGLLSGMPLSTVPALLASGRGPGSAATADVASGAVIGCALASLFALAYHSSSRRLGPGLSLGFSVASLALGVLLLSSLAPTLPLAVVLTGAGALAAWYAMLGATYTRAAPTKRLASSELSSALYTGVLCGTLVALASKLSPLMAGIVTAMPVIGVVTVASLHARDGAGAVPLFLRAYVLSSVAKAVFCAAFALCVSSQGMARALAIACVAGVSAYWLARYASVPRTLLGPCRLKHS